MMIWWDGSAIGGCRGRGHVQFWPLRKANSEPKIRYPMAARQSLEPTILMDFPLNRLNIFAVQYIQ